MLPFSYATVRVYSAAVIRAYGDLSSDISMPGTGTSRYEKEGPRVEFGGGYWGKKMKKGKKESKPHSK